LIDKSGRKIFIGFSIFIYIRRKRIYDNKTEVEVKVTWEFAWSLFCRTFLIGLAFSTVLYGILFMIFGASLLALMQ
jgi:hypothetical protein